MSNLELFFAFILMVALHILYARSKHFPKTVVGMIIYSVMAIVLTPIIAVPVMWPLCFLIHEIPIPGPDRPF